VPDSDSTDEATPEKATLPGPDPIDGALDADIEVSESAVAPDSDPAGEEPSDDEETPETTGRLMGIRRFWKRWHRWIIAGTAVLIVIGIAVPVVRVLVAWSNVERVEFDPDAARVVISEQAPVAIAAVSTTQPEIDDAGDTPVTTTVVEAPPDVPFSGVVSDADHTAVLVIGSDAGGFRADVIMLALIPKDGGDLALVSIPRDLYLDDPCGSGRERINAALNGCGDVSGPDLLAIVVEDFTGVPIDHFVLFDFDGFARVIDVAGGVDICVNHYTYDTKTEPGLALLAGCNHVDGSMALAWVRSRHTGEVVNGVSRSIPGVNDLTRNTRQRSITLQLLEKLSSLLNPGDLVALIEAVPGAFTLDEGLSLTTAVGIAWDLRGTPADDVDTPTIPVINHRAANGAQVLLPQESFAETMGWSTG